MTSLGRTAVQRPLVAACVTCWAQRAGRFRWWRSSMKSGSIWATSPRPRGGVLLRRRRAGGRPAPPDRGRDFATPPKCFGGLGRGASPPPGAGAHVLHGPRASLLPDHRQAQDHVAQRRVGGGAFDLGVEFAGDPKVFGVVQIVPGSEGFD